MPRTSSGLVEAVGRVGDRWSLLIVDALLDGARRFGELQESVDGLAPNILSARLKQLEREGLVVSRPYSERPVRVDYELTQQGSRLADALRLLASWGEAGAAERHSSRHAACGGELAVRWWCPSCDEPVDPDADELHWV
jgi:DNA-binding HxlR family transcriptional regulator